MNEFFYTNEDIAKIIRNIMRSRFYIRLVLFACVAGYFIYLINDMNKNLWAIMMITPTALFVFLFIINPGVLKVKLRKAFQSVIIRVTADSIFIGQENLKEINLSVNEIIRIEKHPKGKYFLLHTNLAIKKMKIYCPLNDTEAFEIALGRLREIETEKNSFLNSGMFRSIYTVVSVLAFFPAMTSEKYYPVLGGFLIMLVFLGYNIYDSIIKFPLLKGNSRMAMIFLLFVTGGACLYVANRLFHYF
ncbi:MAG: hypothetical protein IAF38_09715 [Bacteroidia bacterium]|nr:hypothetical protein [Bacteroidia bacterium]